jgi:pterin-4a-carbinolamine dehydratase
MRPSELTEPEVGAALAALNQGLSAPWSIVEQKLEKEFKFANFIRAR